MEHRTGIPLIRGIAMGPVCVAGGGGPALPWKEPVILAAEELSLDMALRLSPACVTGVVTGRGAPNGHVAVVLGALNVPWLAGIAIEAAWHGKPAVLNAAASPVVGIADDSLTLLPGAREAACAREACLHQAQTREWMRKRAMHARPVAGNGTPVRVLASLNELSQARSAFEGGAEGVGLFRSEFLMMEGAAPSEELQYWAYRSLLSQCAGKWAAVRAFDLGADKPGGGACGGVMGLRGVRLLLREPELFRTQLRALLRAAALGPLRVIYPFVSESKELKACHALLMNAQAELAREGVQTGSLTEGAMLETPAAALMAGELAREVDFLCVGSGDLAQYALAADRRDMAAREWYDARHPAVIRLAASAARGAARQGRPLCLCGPLAEDAGIVKKLVDMGVTMFCASPPAIPALRVALSR